MLNVVTVTTIVITDSIDTMEIQAVVTMVATNHVAATEAATVLATTTHVTVVVAAIAVVASDGSGKRSSVVAKNVDSPH